MFLEFGDYTLNVLKGIHLYYIELFYQFLRDIPATVASVTKIPHKIRGHV